MAPNTARILDPADYSIAWIAPLNIEAHAALLTLDAVHEGNFVTRPGDDYIYMAGEINGHNIVIATFPAGQDYGVGSAAALASQVKKTFTKLWFGLLVGVAAGLPNLNKTPPLDIRLGDVLVGVGDSRTAGLVSYGLGRQTTTGFELLHYGYQAKTEAIVRSAIAILKLKDTRLALSKKPLTFLQYYEDIRKQDETFADPGQGMDNLYNTISDGANHPLEVVERSERREDTRTRVWYGPIGSGDKLMRDPKTRDELRDKHNIIGLEMEAVGIENTIPVGVIRGVCDYGDAQKNDAWQAYAAAMAAAYAKAVLYQITPDARGNISTGTQAQEEPDRNIEHQRLASTLPIYSNHMFSGREKELEWIKLQLQNSPVLHQRVCLYGLGSIGKSEIAFEYARRCSSERAIFWVKADTIENLKAGYTSIAQTLIPNFQPKELDVFAVVKEYLESPGCSPWFMVLDGADNPEVFFGNQEDDDCLKYIPQASYGQILITSRDERLPLFATGQLVSPTNGCQIGPMSTQDGTALFQKLILRDRQRLHAQILEPQGAKFLDMLGGLPLAIIQATRYMIEVGITIQDFIDLYQKVEAHGLIFGKATRDIDRQVISVLRTWEISYRRIAEDATLESKSHAAMLLDLLGFIDSKSHPILRSISEAEFVFQDDEGPNPMEGFRDASNRQPSLESMFQAQSVPKALLFRVFINKINLSTELDFKSATAKLQRYSLIDEGCWVPPVVHSWISYRLKAEEQCMYIQWLVEELWAEILHNDVESNNRWEDFLLPPTYHELIIHELPLLRHARVLLEHASSKKVLESMAAGNYLAHDTVELLYRLGRMLASAGRTKEGVHYLEKAIAGMESLIPRLPPTLISERRLQLARTRFRTSHLAEAVAEAKTLSESTPSNRAVLWLAQCLQIAGELRDASVIFKNIITILGPESHCDPDCAKVVFAAAFGAASTLSMMSDSASKIEARKLIDKYLVSSLQGLSDYDTLKAVLYPEILIRRLEVAANARDTKSVVQLFLAYDAVNPELSQTRGKPLAWCSLLTDLRTQKRWCAIEALGEAFISERDSFIELWNLRHNRNKEQINSLHVEMDAWLIIYYRLGTAYSELQKYDKAEKVYWDALGLCLGLGLCPPRIDANFYGSLLWRLHMLLAKQKKDRNSSILWYYFQDSIEREVERRKVLAT